MSDDRFCEHCGVSLDLHDGDEPADCENAERKADLMDRFWSVTR